jgi:hypothetical protein
VSCILVCCRVAKLLESNRLASGHGPPFIPTKGFHSGHSTYATKLDALRKTWHATATVVTRHAALELSGKQLAYLHG